MTRIESDIAEIKNTSEKIFNFLTDLTNLGLLMPPQVINWKCTGDSCTFTIKGMTDLSMKILEKVPDSKIVFSPGNTTPFDFKLIVTLLEKQAGTTDAQIFFEAELNSVMEIMVRTPLMNFANMLVGKLKEISEKL